MSASALESPVRGIEGCRRGSGREDTSEDLVLEVGMQCQCCLNQKLKCILEMHNSYFSNLN